MRVFRSTTKPVRANIRYSAFQTLPTVASARGISTYLAAHEDDSVQTLARNSCRIKAWQKMALPAHTTGSTLQQTLKVSSSLLTFSRSCICPALCIGSARFLSSNNRNITNEILRHFFLTGRPVFRPAVTESPRKLPSYLLRSPTTTFQTRSYWPPYFALLFAERIPTAQVTAQGPRSLHENRTTIVLGSVVALMAALVVYNEWSCRTRHKPSKFHVRPIAYTQPVKGELACAYGTRWELEMAGHRCIVPLPELPFAWAHMMDMQQGWIVR
jgi:hypothetical protein